AFIKQQGEPLPDRQPAFRSLRVGRFGSATLPDPLFLVLHLQQKCYEPRSIRPETHRTDVHLRFQPIRRFHFILHRVSCRPPNFVSLSEAFILLKLPPQRARRVAFPGAILKRARIPLRAQSATFQSRFCPDLRPKNGAIAVILLPRRLLFLLIEFTHWGR